jgi:adenosylhomocysteinase
MTDTATPVAAAIPPHDVTDLGLADEGIRRIEWAEREMPVLRLIRERFERERPLAGIRIGACLHVTTETANLMRTLKAGGADVVLAASNPLSTKDDVAAALVAEYGIATFARAWRGPRHLLRPPEQRRRHAPADHDGRRLRPRLAPPQRAPRPGQGGPRRHRGDDDRRDPAEGDGGRQGALGFPVVAVNEALTKHLFDNRYGTGQSTSTGFLRATNILLAGRNVVDRRLRLGRAGGSRRGCTGWAPTSRSSRSTRPGARGAHGRLSGDDRRDAAPWGELFVTATGNLNVFRREHFAAMQDGAIMANSATSTPSST